MIEVGSSSAAARLPALGMDGVEVALADQLAWISMRVCAIPAGVKSPASMAW